ncbi:expressed unknown protein [Seminavis robusta]|uniref:Transmembrane protein n=1 Tax=Seminavis robusta TaxID=568900 RepID=A0A9N8H4B3_9STRA|nr:expressed unknown protein [Seminavis robusta]|eukprot:Sro81_g043340.1 n/a (398) ;mRNA; r:15410-16603
MSNSTSTSTSESSSSSCSAIIKGGELHVSVLSIENLPSRESPWSVQLEACGETTSTSTCTKPDPTNKDDTLVIKTKTLQSLHEASAVLTIQYEKDPTLNRQATFAMKDLVVNQVATLVLELESSPPSQPLDPNTTTCPTTTPTIQLQVQLRGALRRELRALVRFGHGWFALMDALERTVCRIVPSNTVTQRLVFIPALLATLLLTPLVGGILALALPVLFPLAALLMTTAACLAVAFVLVYFSTSRGRHKYMPLIQPAINKCLYSTPGQALLYPVGPRPTPVTFVETVVPDNMYGRLVLSVVIDIIGCSSYLLPFMGEASDVIWAPIQTLLIMAMYETTTPKLKYLSFAEEMLPFTDVIPSATIGWAAQFGPELMGRNSSSSSSTGDNKQPQHIKTE